MTSPAMIQAKHLVFYWYFKGLKAMTINEKWKADFGELTLEIQQLRSGAETKLKPKYGILDLRRGSKQPPEVALHGAILSALNKFPFHGLRWLARVLKSTSSTICHHLVREGFAVKHLKWVLHGQRDSWGHFVIRDEI
jgi:hypothetical protein